VLLLVCFAARLHPTWALPLETPPWIRLQSSHFVAYSDAGEPQARKVLLELEQFRNALSILHPGFSVDAPRPTYIFIFHDDQAYLPYKRMVSGRPVPFGGYFAPTPDADYVSIRLGKDDSLGLVRHEFVHEFLRNNLAYVPSWLNEGLAEFYRTFQATPTGANIGLPIEQHLNLLSTTAPMPLAELFLVTPASQEINEETWQGRFYATSWAIVHLLVSGGTESGRKQLGGLLDKLRKGSSVDDAFHQTFIDGPEALEKTLQAYVKQRQFLYTSVQFATSAPVEAEINARVMKRDEVLVSLSDLLIHVNDQPPAAAEEHLRAALALNPGNGAAYAGLATLLDQEDKPSEALPYIEKAVVLSPDDFLVQYRCAAILTHLPNDALQGTNASSDETPPLIVRARAALRKAVALRPGFAEAHVLLGLTYSENPGNVADGIAALEQARRLIPSRMDVAYHLVLLYLRNNERASAQALVDDVLGRSGNGVMLAAAQRALSGSEPSPPGIDAIGVYNQAVELANHGNYKRAVSLLEKTLPEIKNPEMAGKLHELLERLKRDAVRQHKPSR
jgi:tetratricopeptide (TPR) repeat protein